jgi:magnesium transporter
MLPVILQRAGFDPAVASSALLTSVTDLVGFYVFLALAAILLL